jgi:peptide/nickel transport system substrate-binding protein
MLLTCLATIGCTTQPAPRAADNSTTTLRVGIGGAPAQTAERGVQQFISNLSNEGLLRVDQEGRLGPWLAQSWELRSNGLAATLRLRAKAKFQDGTPITPALVTTALLAALPKSLGSVYEDVDTISSTSTDEIEIKFRRPSPFVLESLFDIPIQKSGASGGGTGPFMAVPSAGDGKPSEIVANPNYDLGAPTIGRVVTTTYPNVRAAWADLLRDRLDVLYEVGSEALDSMQGAKNVSLYAFDRPFQFMLLLNTRLPKLRSAEVRRALNQAIDRGALVRDALASHGTPSAGPVSPHHWAFRNDSSTFTFDPGKAAERLKANGQDRSARFQLTLTCLTPAFPPYDRVALVVQQQLAAVGVDLVVEEATPDRIAAAFADKNFDVVLMDPASGWGVFRGPYRWWHSHGSANLGFSSTPVDAALDAVRHAATDADYREGVKAFQKAIADDPPAVFLAWSNRSRAVTHRFDVPAEPSRDVLATLRLWKPTADARQMSRN